MSGQGDATDVFRILLVCTGNICRSALAERLGRAYVTEALGEDAGLVELVSAGTGAVVGSAMHPDSALVLQGFGAESDGFTARQLRPNVVEGSDLVLTMTRAHRRAVLEASPRALSRTFTLREAADLLSLVGDVELGDHRWPQNARELVRDLATARSRREVGSVDDVPDPVNQPLEVHQQAGDLIAEALLPILGCIATLTAPGKPYRADPSPTDDGTVS